MTTSLKIFLSIIFFTIVLSSCQTTQIKKVQCKSEFKVSYWKEKLQVEELIPLKETQRVIFLSYFNNEPPITDRNPKYVIIYVHPYFDRSIVLFKDDDPCIDSVHMIPTSVIKEWLTSKGI
tara:strand:+ start:402 stop:764 length:363 start_codon:yes stop_codon:yes gene_type:complete